GDFLGKGYDQRATITDSGKVEIFDHTAKGGAKLKEFGTGIIPWYKYKDTTYNRDLADKHGLSEQKIAGYSGGFLVAGPKLKAFAPGDPNSNDAYGSTLYWYTPDGKRTRTLDLPDVKAKITSMNVGVVQGEEVVALGLSDGGVRIYRTSNASLVKSLGTDWNRGGYWERDLVSAVKFGDIGDGKVGLAVGRMGYDTGSDSTGTAYMFNASDGYKELWKRDPVGSDKQYRAPAYFAFGDFKGDGTRQVAIGWFEWKLAMQNKPETRPTVSVKDAVGGGEVGKTKFASGYARGLTVADVPGKKQQNLVLETATGAGQGANSEGRVLQYDGVGTLVPQPAGPEGQDTLTVSQLTDSFPGYRAAQVRVKNASGTPIEVQLLSKDDQEKGCWINTDTGGKPAAPSSMSRIEAGATSPDYFSAASLSGTCAGGSDRRYSYIAVQPVGKAGERTLVKLAHSGATLKSEEKVSSGPLD
ncbi:hypothetical protein, partial [Streptomyces sp. NPDC057910]|uniref:hypothetical protein n=1 Tax=Streptomyces sp. NPDC057910 TaxID=3346278 RepID=UPI0036EAD623